jgi:hypothetical protein
MPTLWRRLSRQTRALREPKSRCEIGSLWQTYTKSSDPSVCATASRPSVALSTVVHPEEAGTSWTLLEILQCFRPRSLRFLVQEVAGDLLGAHAVEKRDQRMLKERVRDLPRAGLGLFDDVDSLKFAERERDARGFSVRNC